MKKTIYSLLVCLTFVLVSCDDKTSFDDSRITYYASFDVKGDQTMQVTVNTPFVDPGVVATMNGVDVSNKIVLTGSVNANTVGLYKLNYAVTNADGFTTSASRTVIVCDPSVTTDISGNYTTVSGTYRLRAGAVVNFPGYKVAVTKVAPGFFYVSDFFGGYYDQKAAYGVKYAESGYVQLHADNTMSVLSSAVLPWGDTITSLDNAVYDPATKSISWAAQYAGSMTFYVVLK